MDGVYYKHIDFFLSFATHKDLNLSYYISEHCEHCVRGNMIGVEPIESTLPRKRGERETEEGHR